jgi:hypothetical protein
MLTGFRQLIAFIRDPLGSVADAMSEGREQLGIHQVAGVDGAEADRSGPRGGTRPSEV